MHIAPSKKAYRLQGAAWPRPFVRPCRVPELLLAPSVEQVFRRCQARYGHQQTGSLNFGTLRSFLHTVLTVAVAVFVIPVAAMIALVGSFSPPATAAEVQETPTGHSSSIRSAHSTTSIPASIQYSRSSGVTPSKLHAVLRGSNSLNIRTALNSTAQHTALMNVGSSTIQGAFPSVDISGDGRDRVSDVLKVLDSRLDNAISGAQGSALRAIPSLTPSDADEVMKAHELSKEAVELVHQVWLDARGTGLDRDKWLQECMAEIDSRPPKTLLQAHLLIKGFLARGPSDPYTRFIPPEEYKQLTKFDVSGVGANVSSGKEYLEKVAPRLPRNKTPDGGVWVLGIIKGLAADQAGMRQGDEIISVDGVPAETRTPFQIASLLRTPPPPPPTTPPTAGTPSSPQTTTPETTSPSQPPTTSNNTANTPSTPTSSISWSVLSSYFTTSSGASDSSSGLAAAVVEVVHENGAPETLRIARGKSSTVANPVSTVALRGDAGYVKLRTFNARAVPELRAAVADLERNGAQQLILDLSDNRGGLVSEAIEIARLFLPRGSTVVSTKGLSTTNTTRVEQSSPVTELPVVLLVNSSTASASEILAGALKDNCRAVVAGGPTYGKGLIQSVYELSDASGMAVTVGKYFTPAGVDIDRAGVAADFSSPPRKSALNRALGTCKIPKQ